MKKFTGKYLGPLKIEDVKETKEVTYLGKPKVIVVYEDEEECLPLAMVEAGVTDTESDWTELRERRGMPVIKKIMAALTEAELTKLEIQYITGPKLIESINLAFGMANEKLWGKIYDNITLKDADKILTGESCLCTTKVTTTEEKKK